MAAADADDIGFMVDNLEALALACRTADMCAAIEAALEGEPLVVQGSRGQSTVNPLVVELRLQRSSMAALLKQVGFPEAPAGDGAWDGLSASQRARKAALARYR